MPTTKLSLNVHANPRSGQTCSTTHGDQRRSDSKQEQAKHEVRSYQMPKTQEHEAVVATEPASQMAPDVEGIIRQATTETIPLTTIDFDDHEFLARLSHDGWIFQAAAAMAGTPGRFPASKSV
jgi:hypothetical protein